MLCRRVNTSKMIQSKPAVWHGHVICVNLKNLAKLMMWEGECILNCKEPHCLKNLMGGCFTQNIPLKQLWGFLSQEKQNFLNWLSQYEIPWAAFCVFKTRLKANNLKKQAWTEKGYSTDLAKHHHGRCPWVYKHSGVIKSKWHWKMAGQIYT